MSLAAAQLMELPLSELDSWTFKKNTEYEYGASWHQSPHWLSSTATVRVDCRRLYPGGVMFGHYDRESEGLVRKAVLAAIVAESRAQAAPAL